MILRALILASLICTVFLKCSRDTQYLDLAEQTDDADGGASPDADVDADTFAYKDIDKETEQEPDAGSNRNMDGDSNADTL